MRTPLLLAAAGLALAGCHSQPDVTNGAVPTVKATDVAAPAGQAWTDMVVATPEGGYRMGNPNAPLKLVEYGSRTCPTCGKFGREGLDPLEKKYVASGKLSFEFREFFVHGPPDVPAGLLGRCAGAEPFFPLLEAMYKNQDPFEQKLGDTAATSALQAKTQNMTPVQSAQAWAAYMGFVDFVKQQGIPEDQAMKCLADAKELDHLTAVMNDAAANKGVTGTPTFFLNGQKLDSIEWATLEPLLKQAGA